MVWRHRTIGAHLSIALLIIGLVTACSTPTEEPPLEQTPPETTQWVVRAPHVGNEGPIEPGCTPAVQQLDSAGAGVIIRLENLSLPSGPESLLLTIVVAKAAEDTHVIRDRDAHVTLEHPGLVINSSASGASGYTRVAPSVDAVQLELSPEQLDTLLGNPRDVTVRITGSHGTHNLHIDAEAWKMLDQGYDCERGTIDLGDAEWIEHTPPAPEGPPANCRVIALQENDRYGIGLIYDGAPTSVGAPENTLQITVVYRSESATVIRAAGTTVELVHPSGTLQPRLVIAEGHGVDESDGATVSFDEVILELTPAELDVLLGNPADVRVEIRSGSAGSSFVVTKPGWEILSRGLLCNPAAGRL